MVRQTLTDSIEALMEEDFNCISGFKNDLYLDPEREKVYTHVGKNSMPMEAFHNIDTFIISIHPKAIPTSVYNAVKAIENGLDSLIDEFRGTEWNGNDHIGQWTEDAGGILECLAQIQHKIAYYWDPSDWFESVSDSDIQSLIDEGRTAEQIVDTLGCGNDTDGMVDRTDAISWMTNHIEWLKEQDL